MSSNNIWIMKNERRRYKKFVKSFKFSESDIYYLCEAFKNDPSLNNEKYLRYTINNGDKVVVIKCMKKFSIDWRKFV